MTNIFNNDEDFGCATQFLTESSFWFPEWIPIAPPSAWLEHGPFAFWITEVHRPACLVELGSLSGFSYMAFCQSVKSHHIATRCYAVDTWQGDEHTGGPHGEGMFARVNDHNQKQYSGFSSLIRSTFDQAVVCFSDASIDLLHIDGYHVYESVKHDFITWLPKLSKRGIVLFHDTNVRQGDFGVWRLWQELAGKYPHFEFFHGNGLGVLGVGNEFSPTLQNLFAVKGDSATATNIRSIYARLGSAITGKAHLAAIYESRQRSWFKRAFHRYCWRKIRKVLRRK